ncbi:MAG: GntR family transcriptional regulator [Alphaproteobacteria bacterium]|nr:GntR family transcriptional regulator [Alphaproteobacteria bacterium]MBT4083964.1 GntR family transcriptional regulator [Alphaproteobacteria bacterium]MBT5158697.1 GntR family transcriptional regulator [Alphaproteobacteria bacterium]MBT5919172.1 GntR family transcriptional regulator [Alphaproteobacteria bacterium]MBT6386561.1 GntR family transcriptional regulator [Alphaproteobacteria bacterium]
MGQQFQRAVATLRRMIVSGDLAPGLRLTETTLANQLEVSRMPIRMALPALEQEGLLEKAGKRGFRVRQIKPGDIADAIEVRGTLEGLAARLMVETGRAADTLSALKDCLQQGDAVFADGQLRTGDFTTYHAMNMRFHQTIVDASGNTAIAVALHRNDALPLASANSITIDEDHLDQEFRRLHFAHMQHHLIVEAAESGQASRAEALMREHANAALKYSDLFSQDAPMPENYRVITGGQP